jgi:hypothetical protein
MTEGTNLKIVHPGSTLLSPIRISALGGSTILASLLFYQSILSNFSVQTRNIEFLQLTAYFVLGLVLLGIVVTLWGATSYFMRIRSKNDPGTSLTAIGLSLALNDKRSFRVFVLSTLMYAVLFGFFSSFFVYQPLGILSETTGAHIPSAFAVVCCGQFGQMPQFVIYLSQQFAVLIIPANLILLVTVSWLVGLNAGIAAFAYKNRSQMPRGRWLTGFGAVVGLFTACPSCAGFFLLTTVGLTAAVGLALTLSSLQSAFIAIGLPMLLAAPILTARRMPSNFKCVINTGNSRDPNKMAPSALDA